VARKPIPRPIPDERLRAMSEHVLYEIEMFGRVTDALTPELWRDVPTFLADTAQNAFVESFTIHVRGLHDFLFATPRDDDASAADWFPGAEAEWLEARGPEPEVLRTARRRTGKEIAHITYARLEGDGKLWPHKDIIEALRTPLFRFLDRVDQSRVSSVFKSRAWGAIHAVPSDPERARSAEPGIRFSLPGTGYGMSVATQAFRPAPP
jgi:hypothetical protein